MAAIPETAFAVQEQDQYRLRWFTPGGEIDLCGHATLATAYVIMRLSDGEVQAVRTDYDCVSRSFAPELNVAEDPVCGSGHCHIMPYWAQELNKMELTAYQASRRGGVLYGKVDRNRIHISGKAVLCSEAVIYVG